MKQCIVPENFKLIVAKLVNIPDIACMDAGKGREQDAEAFTAFRVRLFGQGWPYFARGQESEAMILKFSDTIHSSQN